MTETKTVELPLTKAEQRHLDNVRRRDEKRRRAQDRRDAAHERDAILKEINAKYLPQIKKLQEKAAEERKAVWEEWCKRRDAAA